MQSRTNSSGTTVLLIIILIITFPFWIGILGGLFGLIVGAIGAVFGILGAVFGAVFGGIGALFGALFNGHWGIPMVFAFGGKLMIIAMIVAVVVLITRAPRKR
jgi:hypothetical protein